MMLKVGKLYRHHMIKTHPGMTIRACYVKRVHNEWYGGIDTIGDITEYGHAMLLVEYQKREPYNRSNYAIFLVGDRFVRMDPCLVEPIP